MNDEPLAWESFLMALPRGQVIVFLAVSAWLMIFAAFAVIGDLWRFVASV